MRAGSVELAESYLKIATTGAEPLLPGLTELSDVVSALGDQSTVFDPTGTYPIAHDIRLNRWYEGSEIFFRQKGIAELKIGEGRLDYYAGHAALAAAIGEPEQELIKTLITASSERGSDTLFEYTDDPDFRSEVLYAAGDLGLRATWLLGGGHALYASATGYQETGRPPASDFFGSTYEASSTLTKIKQRVDVVPKIDLEDYPDLYKEYVAAFTEVSAAHPTGSTLDEEDFSAVLGSPDFMKFVAYDGKGIAGLCVLAKVQDINWFDQLYMQRHLGAAYDEGRGLACPMIYRRSGAGMMQSSRIFSAMGAVFKSIGTYPRYVVECNNQSIRNIPPLFQRGSMVADAPSSEWKVLQRQAVDVLRVQKQ